MSVYAKDGSALAAVYDKNGNSLAAAYNKNGIDIFSGDVPVDRNKDPYDYYADTDPDKSYVWNYLLSDLKTAQDGHFTIGVQTDTHLTSGASLSLCTPLKNMTKQLYFDFICNLGDMPRGYDADTAAATETAIEELKRRYIEYVESPFIVVNGNHDNACMSSSYISKAGMHEFYIGDNDALSDYVNPTGELYFYKDFQECRVIVLNTEDYPYLQKSSTDIDINHHVFSETQVDWFENVALNTDKPIIVLSHNILVTNVYPEVMVVPQTDIATENCIPYRANEIVSALENFVSNGGTVVACLSGHIHAQRSAKVNGINYIAFANGGGFAELLFIDFDQQTITTKVINNSNISDRFFTF